MDDHVTDLFAEEAEHRYGLCTCWKSVFQVEKNHKKRQWLRHFTSCASVFDNTSEQRGSSATDTLTGIQIPLPSLVFKYSFGFSCKDFRL